jgi:hypothetical protein
MSEYKKAIAYANQAMSDLAESVKEIQSKWPTEDGEHESDWVAIGKAYMLGEAIDAASDLIIMR